MHNSSTSPPPHSLKWYVHTRSPAVTKSASLSRFKAWRATRTCSSLVTHFRGSNTQDQGCKQGRWMTCPGGMCWTGGGGGGGGAVIDGTLLNIRSPVRAQLQQGPPPTWVGVTPVRSCSDIGGARTAQTRTLRLYRTSQRRSCCVQVPR